MGQSDGSSLFRLRQINIIWHRDYRLLIQSVRNVIALLPVIFLFAYTKNQMFIWMGLCVLALMQSNVPSPFWRFEYNIFVTFCVCFFGILLSYFFIHSVFFLVLFSFLVSFFLFLSAYFKLSGVYTTWTYAVIQYSSLSEYNFSDVLQNAFYCFYAFLISLLICVLLMRPNLKKECHYEMITVLEYLAQYADAFKKDIFLNTEKTHAALMEKRIFVFSRVQNIGLQIRDLKKIRNQDPETKGVILMATLVERIAEIAVGSIINVRVANADITEKNQILSILNHFLQKEILFLHEKKILSCEKISEFHQRLILHMNESIVSAQEVSQGEMPLVYSKLQININLLSEEIRQYVSF